MSIEEKLSWEGFLETGNSKINDANDLFATLGIAVGLFRKLW